jgi:hypothetical protein
MSSEVELRVCCEEEEDGLLPSPFLSSSMMTDLCNIFRSRADGLLLPSHFLGSSMMMTDLTLTCVIFELLVIFLVSSFNRALF